MGDWDVVSTTPAQGARPAGEWDVVSTAPARRGGRRGPRNPNGNPTTPPPSAPPRRSGPVRQFGQGLQDTIATGVGLIVNPREAGATIFRSMAQGANEVGARMNDPRNIAGRAALWLNAQADSLGPTAAERTRNVLLNEPMAATPLQRGAYIAGSVLPGLGIPGAAIPTAASGVGMFGAGEMARAGGANEYEAGLAGLAGGLVGGAASVAAPRLASRATPPPVDMAAARRAALESLPPNLRTLPRGANAALEADLAANTRPTDAAVRALNNSLPEPIPMSRGQVSGLPDQQAVENAYRAGASGRGPAQLAQAQRQAAEDAILANLNRFGEQVSGGPVPPRGGGGASVSERLNAMYDTQRNATNRAYTYARDASADAVVADTSRVGGRDLTDQALNIMRRGGRVNEGETLMQWVARNGGIRDQGGELSALDAQLWHKGRPFQRKAVQGADGAGMTLEQAAVAAQEAGFLPERFSRDGVVDTRAQPADLIEAIRRELAGEPVRSQYNAKNQELAQHVRDLEEAAGAAGVDLGSMNNAQARAAIDNYFAGRENAPGGPPPQVPSTALDLGGRLREAMASYDQLNPDVASVFREVGRLSETRPSARLLYDARQRLSRLRGNDTEISAARTAIQELDRYISDALDAGAFDGEPGAVMAWRDALRERRTQGATFESGDLIQQLTEREFRSGARTTSVAPEDAGNRIFGTGNSWINKANLARDLTRLREVMGANSQEWGALRGEHFRRLMDAGQGPLEGGAPTFSGRNFANAWRDARARAMPTLRALYSSEEIAALDRLAFLADRTTTPVTGGRNTSATTTTARALSREGLQRALGRLPFAGPLIEAIFNAPETMNARRVFDNPTPNRGAPRLDRPRGNPLSYREALAVMAPNALAINARRE